MKSIQELQVDIAMLKSRPQKPLDDSPSVDARPSSKVANQDMSAISNDDSIVTIDENVPEIKSKEPLNCLV